MIDPNFDPLEHLEICEIEILKLKHDIRILISSTERLESRVQELTKVSQQHTDLIRVLRRELSDLKMQRQ